MNKEQMLNRVKSFPLQDGEITETQWVGEVSTGPNPLHLKLKNPGGYVRVAVTLHPAAKSHIRVLIGLPGENVWNGKLLGTGNGGAAGTISEFGILIGVSRGYLTVTTDMGTTPEPYDCIGNRDAMEDFGHRATHLMTVVAKHLAEWVYGRPPKFSYFYGGSTGGQQGFSEAQRYPEDYNGIVSLSPAFDRVRLHVGFVWNWQSIHSQENAVFTAQQAADWRKCIENVYRNSCGGADGEPFLRYPGRIHENPMDQPQLKKDAAKMFTEGQRRALRRMYDGPVDPVTGEKIIAGFLPGTESEGLGLTDLSNREKFAHDFFFPFYWFWGRDFDGMKFDFHSDLERAVHEISPILDADNPDLSAFKKAGGKLLVIGGSADPIIPYTGFLPYYRKVIRLQGSVEETTKFFRFFLMPGFAHTMGGKGVNLMDSMGLEGIPDDPAHSALGALSDWVENGRAPEWLLGIHCGKGENGLQREYDLPSYVYPNITKYAGSDPKDCSSYVSEYNEKAFQ